MDSSIADNFKFISGGKFLPRLITEGWMSDKKTQSKGLMLLISCISALNALCSVLVENN